MSGTHPSEDTLQQYVLDRAVCRREDIAHIGDCADCRQAVAAYAILANALKEEPAPRFGFDVAAPVIAQLEMRPRRKHREGHLLTGVLIALVIALPAWLFRRTAYFVFTDMSAEFYWMLLVTTGIVVGLFLLRLYKKYQDVINLINK